MLLKKKKTKKIEKASKFRLMRIKESALKLYNNYQIPFKLMFYINTLDSNSSLDHINYLMECAESMMRVTNYYKKHPDIAKQYNDLIDEGWKKIA